MYKVMLIGLGGFVGAIGRYSLASLAHRVAGEGFLVGTLLVNILGCLVIGAFMAVAEESQLSRSDVHFFVIIGLIGSFTTFSAFAHETHELLRNGSMVAAGGNILANVLVGVCAVMAGRGLVKLVA